MNQHALTLVGAGEFTSILDGSSTAYLRFRTADGREADISSSPEQIAQVLALLGGESVQEDSVLEKALPGPARTDLGDDDEDAPLRIPKYDGTPFAPDDL